LTLAHLGPYYSLWDEEKHFGYQKNIEGSHQLLAMRFAFSGSAMAGSGARFARKTIFTGE